MPVIFFPWPGKPNYFFAVFGFGIERAKNKLPHGRWGFSFFCFFEYFLCRDQGGGDGVRGCIGGRCGVSIQYCSSNEWNNFDSYKFGCNLLFLRLLVFYVDAGHS